MQGNRQQPPKRCQHPRELFLSLFKEGILEGTYKPEKLEKV